MDEEKLSEIELLNRIVVSLDDALSNTKKIKTSNGKALAHMIYGALSWLACILDEERKKIKVIK